MSELPILPVPSSPLGQPSKLPGPGGQGEGGSFKDVLAKSLEEVNRMQVEAQQAVNKFATGETTNQAEVIAAVRQAEIAFQLMTEVRNKLVDAYQEVMRMRV